MTSEDEEIVAQILSDLAKNDKKPRKHANFFEFWKKPVKETGIFEEFITKIKYHPQSGWYDESPQRGLLSESRQPHLLLALLFPFLILYVLSNHLLI